VVSKQHTALSLDRSAHSPEDVGEWRGALS